MLSQLDRLARRAEISAIICTRNRADLLRRALAGLAGQSIDRTRFEVVVVDDGSTDTTRQVVESFQANLRVVYQYQRPAGVASARNHGLFLAAAPILLFLDDDDVADARLLEQHLLTHARHPADEYAVLGYTGLSPDIAADPLMHFVTQVGCLLFSYVALSDGDVLDYTYFWGGRTSCKRRFLLDHGVFDPLFRFGCEDIELGYRLSQHGLRVVYNANARSTMLRSFTFDGFCERLRRQGRSNYNFYRLHPTAEVERWADLAAFNEKWSAVASEFDRVIERARVLDRVANLKLQWGLPMPERERELLHAAYRAAFRSARLRGSVEAQYVYSPVTGRTPRRSSPIPAAGVRF